jgi:hypothetical protein
MFPGITLKPNVLKEDHAYNACWKSFLVPWECICDEFNKVHTKEQ